MNGTQLRDLLDERSAFDARVLHHQRMARVHRKVVVRRQRRIAAGTAVVAVLVTGTAAGIAALVERPAGGRDAAGQSGAVEDFPEYDRGARVVASAAERMPARTASLTFAPTTMNLVIFSRCRDSGGTVVMIPPVEFAVDGRSLGAAGGCSGAFQPKAETLTTLGVRTGVPTTLTMTLKDVLMPVDQLTAAVGPIDELRFALAVGERVPFSSYPLPARPDPLPVLRSVNPSLPDNPGADAPVFLRSNPADPTRPVRLRTTWSTPRTIEMVSQTPGVLRVYVDGVAAAVHESWDYTQTPSTVSRDHGPRPRSGQHVTVRVVPEHMTGAWEVLLSQ